MTINAKILSILCGLLVHTYQGHTLSMRNMPHECRGPPKGVDKPEECCSFPPFFLEYDYDVCGFRFGKEDYIPDCAQQICLLKRYGLVKKGDKVDLNALKMFLDNWAADNPDYQPAMVKAQKRCLGKRLYGLHHMCEVNKLVFCINSTLFAGCPRWEPTEQCQKLKKHIQKCSPYYP